MLNATVLMSSGDTDTWTDIADAFEQDGSLTVISKLEGDEVPADMKVCQIVRQVDQGPDLPPTLVTDTFEVNSVYAPGMWMKVEFSRAS